MKALPILITALIAGGIASLLAFYYNPQPSHDIVGQLEGDDLLPVTFEDATNLTNNGQDLSTAKSRHGTAASTSCGRIPLAAGITIFS